VADLELDNNGKNIVYPSLDLFLKGGTGADGRAYPKVDMSLWDQVTMCGTCHVGGAFYEHDRNGVRLPMRELQDMASGEINPFTTTVWEKYTVSGTDTSQAGFSPWIYPATTDNKQTAADYSNAMLAPNGFGSYSTTTASGKMKQLMMPNVREMDCLFCHLSGYDNVMATVMVQAGSLNAVPAVGARLMDMIPLSPTYMGYDGSKVTTATVPSGHYMGMQTVSLSDTMVAKINAKPDTNNCLQCHATKTLKNFPEMFGVTGTSSGFMSSAPMIYDPPNAVGPLGRRMVAYDINAPWLPDTMNSPAIDMSNMMSYMMPGLTYLSAMGSTPFSAIDPMTQLGGGNKGKTGPLYNYNAGADPAAALQDQSALKYGTAVFARAEWFKRGDAWQDGQDVHGSLGCAGCHFTGDTLAGYKGQCDPGKGFDMASGQNDGVPPLKNRDLVTTGQGGFSNYSGLQTPSKHDTRNTVKRCEFCHITGKDYHGNPINTFGAPDPTTAHQFAGLLANINQIVDKVDLHGNFGAQGIAKNTDFTNPNTTLDKGNHLDVMDCTVCHVQKKSMTVRALDCTSGNRYPSVVGTDPDKGMFGLFEDPGPDSANAAAVNQTNGMYAAINTYFGYTGGEAQGALCAVGSQAYMDNGNTQVPGPGYYAMIPAGTHVIGGKLQEWKPLRLWQKLGNMDLPLTAPGIADAKDTGQMTFRRKIYLSNAITSVMWNNTDPNVDANGDGAPGGILDENKPSLKGYKDIFSGDPVDKNNTQGYGDPIYDVWIMHDLKAGMNFGPGNLSVIAVGFGGLGTPAGVTDPTNGVYQSIFNADHTFTGAFKYASIWSGAVVLSEPEEITAYKDYRNAMEAAKPAADRKSWDGTKLVFIGAPFMVTHGVKSTTEHVLGKSCADCHAPGAGFFKAGFTMTGTAIPADRTYNPTAKRSTTQNASGDYTRNPGVPGLATASTMFERPLEPYRVKAKIGDLGTGFEGFNKLGQPRTIKFEDSDGTYTWTKDLQQADLLYPEEDGAIYYKVTDTNADGTPKTGAVPMTGQDYANYMETQVSINPAAYGIGIAPKAVINPITDIDATQTGTQVAVNAAFPVTAQFAQPNAGNTADLGTVTYAWTTNDPAAVITNPTTRTAATINFTTTGTKIITLTVKDEEGKVSSSYVTVYAVVPPIAIAWADNAGNLGGTANISNLLNTTKYVKTYWGDGSYTTQTITVGATTASPTHTYATAGSKLIQVYAYNSLQKQISYMQQSITVNGAN